KVVKSESSKSEYDCPECKKKKLSAKLILRHSKYGAFYSCENYSNKEYKCTYKANVGEDNEPVEKVKKEVTESKIDCPKCGKKLVIRQGKKGEFLGCRSFPKCQGLYDMDGNVIEFKKKSKG